MRQTARRTAAALAATVLAMGIGASAAHASDTTVTGTVNCTGSETVYSTVRYMQQPARSDLYLAQAAGGVHSGYSMDIGTYIVATGVVHRAYFLSAGWYGTHQSGNNDVVNTRFRMTAKMHQASSGTARTRGRGR